MNMDEVQALDIFAALSQPARLQMVRLLVVAGPDGLAAGAVAAAVGASASSASFHLAHLERAGLVRSRRRARSIVYAADFSSLSGVVTFLMQDCCGGRPEICGPAAAIAASCCTVALAASAALRS